MTQSQEHITEATRRVDCGEYGVAAQIAISGPGYHGKVVYEGGRHVVICFAGNGKPTHLHYDEDGAIIRTSGCWCQEIKTIPAPTPWTIRYVDGRFPQWVDANGKDVPPTKEQAERVRDAVNAHDALLEAARAISIEGNCLCAQMDEPPCTVCKARKAIALAEGGKDGAK